MVSADGRAPSSWWWARATWRGRGGCSGTESQGGSAAKPRNPPTYSPAATPLVGYGAPISGLPEIGIFDAQVGQARPACACPTLRGEHLHLAVERYQAGLDRELGLMLGKLLSELGEDLAVLLG